MDYTIDMFGTLGLISCLPCHVSCLTCSATFSQTSCLTCNLATDHRILNSGNNTCACVGGYYDGATASDVFSLLSTKSVCLQCQYTCETCVDTSACGSCNATLQRTMSGSTGFCECSAGYYDDLINETCNGCPVACTTCSSATVCTGCQNTRTLANGSCACTVGYYETNATECQACGYTLSLIHI